MAIRSRSNGGLMIAAVLERARGLYPLPLSLRIPLAWLEALADVLATFTAVKLGFYIVAAFGLWMVPEVARPWTPSAFFSTPEIVNVAYHWDGEWYVFIAQHGYEVKREGFSTVAFFPLLPLLINLVGRLLAPENLPYAGLIVVNAAFAGALFYLRALANMDAARGPAQRAIWFVSIMPAAFFFNVIYSESLFLLAAAATIYHARRGQLWLAGGWAVLASLTRVQGVLLALVIAWELLRMWRERRALPWHLVPTLALPPMGVVLYMAHLYERFGEPLAFLQAQAAWNRTFTFPLVTLWQSLRVVLAGQGIRGETYGIETMNALVVLAFLVVALLSAGRWPAAYNIYVFTGIFVALMSPSQGFHIMSGARFMAVLFPVAFSLAFWSEERPGLGRAVTMLSLPLFGLLTALFVAWREVY